MTATLECESSSTLYRNVPTLKVVRLVSSSSDEMLEGAGEREGGEGSEEKRSTLRML